MFYGASPSTFQKAKMLRANMTSQEKLLWEELKGNKVDGLRFKSQHPIDTFIADFYCHKLHLVIEIDGDSHNSNDQKEYDEGRTYDMEKHGIRTLRFTNQEIENDVPSVIRSIKKFAEGMLK